MGALVAATTHYAELKVYAMTTPGVENASCEFNVDSLAPTYRLLIGIPGKSNAFAISERLGLPKSIIQKAAARIDAENVRFEDVLTQLDEQRQEMEREKEAAARLRREMEETAKASREYKAKMEAERAKAVEKAQAEARAILGPEVPLSLPEVAQWIEGYLAEGEAGVRPEPAPERGTKLDTVREGTR